MALNYDSTDPTQIPVPGPIRGNYDPALLPLLDTVDLGGAFIKSAAVSDRTLTLTVQLADNTEVTVTYGRSDVEALVRAGVKPWARDTGEGIPSYSFRAATYDPADHLISAIIDGIIALESPAVIYGIFPSDIDRHAHEIDMEIAGRRRDLVSVHGGILHAFELTPGDVHAILVTNTNYRLLEPLDTRPQDFVIVVVVSASDMLTQADLDGTSEARLAVSTDTSPRVNLPANPGGLRAPNRRRDRINVPVFYGVPADAPNIRGLASGSDGRTPSGIGAYPGSPEITGLTYGGVPYKFVASSASLGADDSTGDPPTAWRAFNEDNSYWIFAFVGLPDPSFF